MNHALLDDMTRFAWKPMMVCFVPIMLSINVEMPISGNAASVHAFRIYSCLTQAFHAHPVVGQKVNRGTHVDDFIPAVAYLSEDRCFAFGRLQLSRHLGIKCQAMKLSSVSRR
jgi:hypothetical protein